jgi:hypothetical protein
LKEKGLLEFAEFGSCRVGTRMWMFDEGELKKGEEVRCLLFSWVGIISECN